MRAAFLFISFLALAACSQQISAPSLTVPLPQPRPTPQPKPSPQPVPPEPGPTKPRPYITCSSQSAHAKHIDIWIVDFKEVPDLYQNPLPKCTNLPGPRTSAEVTYSASGTTISSSGGKQKRFWFAAAVVDEANQATLFYQYSDFVVRTDACTQGMFISDKKDVLEFRSNEPQLGAGFAVINGEKLPLTCR